MTEKERYATVGTWIEFFQKEGSSISDHTVRKRLADAGISGRTARHKDGRLLQRAFYAETAIRKHCADLLDDLPMANEDGLIDVDGELFGSISGLSRLLGLSQTAILNRMAGNRNPFFLKEFDPSPDGGISFLISH